MSELLVYESEPKNAAILARLGDVKLREVRSLMQLKRAMEELPAQIVAIEITALENLPAVVNLVRTIKRHARKVAVIALPRGSNVDFATNAWLYESGVDLIFASILHREAAKRLIHRTLTRHAASSMAERADETPFRSKVMSRLPWKRFATATTDSR